MTAESQLQFAEMWLRIRPTVSHHTVRVERFCARGPACLALERLEAGARESPSVCNVGWIYGRSIRLHWLLAIALSGVKYCAPTPEDSLYAINLSIWTQMSFRFPRANLALEMHDYTE